MQLTRVVNLWRERCDVRVDRTGPFGNPYRLANPSMEARLACIAQFQTHFLERLRADPDFRQRVEALRGRVLGCHCKPAPCHGDVIAGFLNGELSVDEASSASDTTRT